MMSDVLWADPVEDLGNKKTNEYFMHNHVRGCSYFLSYQAACAFLEKTCCRLFVHMKLKMPATKCILRPRRLVPVSYYHLQCTELPGGVQEVYKNKAAIFEVREQCQFNCTQRPYFLPNSNGCIYVVHAVRVRKDYRYVGVCAEHLQQGGFRRVGRSCAI